MYEYLQVEQNFEVHKNLCSIMHWEKSRIQMTQFRYISKKY